MFDMLLSLEQVYSSGLQRLNLIIHLLSPFGHPGILLSSRCTTEYLDHGTYMCNGLEEDSQIIKLCRDAMKTKLYFVVGKWSAMWVAGGRLPPVGLEAQGNGIRKAQDWPAVPGTATGPDRRDDLGTEQQFSAETSNGNVQHRSLQNGAGEDDE